jgi:hypothetical protein
MFLIYKVSKEGVRNPRVFNMIIRPSNAGTMCKKG